MKKVVAFIAVLIMGFNTVASAGELFSMSIDYDEVTTDGTIDKLVFEVPNEKKEGARWFSWYITNEDGDIVGVGESRPTQTASTLVNPDIHTTGKEYTVHFTVDYFSKPSEADEYSFTYYTLAEVKAAILKVLNGESTFGIEQPKIGLNMTGLYTVVSPSGSNDSGILAEMKTALNWQTGDASPEPTVFRNAFDASVLDYALGMKNSAVVDEIISNYNNITNLENETEYIIYTVLSTERKTSIVDNIATREYGSVAEFKQGFKTCVYLDSLEGENSSSLISKIRTNKDTYYDYNSNSVWTQFSIDLSDYDGLTEGKKEIAAIQMATKAASGITTLAGLQTALNDSVTYAKNYTPGSGTGVSSPNGPSTNNNNQSPGMTINSTFPTSTSAPRFKDIDNVSWAKTEIEEFAAKGIVNGRSDTEFAPNDDITREEFVAIVVRAFDLTATGDVDYTDIDKSQWYYEPIRIATKHGIVSGDDNKFGLGQNITRQDMAVILYRVAQNQRIDMTAKTGRVLKDINEASDYAQEPITVMYQAEFVDGMGDGIFAPKETATRAQAVKMIYNIYKLK